ncbi:MAG TPA: magnesium transporter CorA family protein [Vicinamibacterales bacterium]
MVTIFVWDGKETRAADAVDPAWLLPDSGHYVWVDLTSPTDEEAKLLERPFGFHELSIEDALSEIHTPKIESYGSYLYIILHGIDFKAAQHTFATHEVDIFLGPQFLVTVHDEFSRSLARVAEVCPRNDFVLAEGPVALLHRIVDGMVDNYRPEVDKLDARLDEIEEAVFTRPSRHDVRRILELKQDVGSLRRVVTPQRDVIGRLARREFPLISESLSYRFRDVYDHLVRLSDEAALFHDRVSALLDAQLSFTSNRLNEVMKTLTIISTVFLPLTVLTGMFGMNVALPRFPGGDAAQFWWIFALMGAMSGLLLWIFNRAGWR